MGPCNPPSSVGALVMAAALAAAITATAALPPPTVLLHLSDMHFSTNARKYWKTFGDRQGDALLLAQHLVPRLGLSGAAITGDITDSKTAQGAGLQQEAEWLAYAGLLDALNASGLPPSHIWDVPGNHDTFNMPTRGSGKDFFSKYSAEGQRRSSPHQRVYWHRVPQEPPAIGAGTSQQRGIEAEDCPAAWLIGIDPTPDPGLRSPTNFAGLAGQELIAEARAALESIQEQQSAECSGAVILGYCHYPLSTIDSSPRATPGPIGALLHAAQNIHPMQGLTKLLAQHNVSAVLSGHLHAAFGQMTHRMHVTPVGGQMAELETAAWKDDRRFRLLAVDGGAIAFLDLFFHTRNSPSMRKRSDAAAMHNQAWREAYSRRGWAVTAVDPSATVIDYIAHITWPPDARYSPLGGGIASGHLAVGEQQEEGAGGWARALVFSLEGSAAMDGLQVELTGWLPSGSKLFSRSMQLQQGNNGNEGPLLFAADSETTVSCVGASGDPAAHCHAPAQHVLIQVSVSSTNGPISRSPQQPVALQCRPLTAAHQQCWVAAPTGHPLPLASSVLEWLALAFNWPVLVHRLFLCIWVLQAGGMLLVPRLLRSRVLPVIAAAPLLQCRPVQQQLAPTPLESTSGSSWGPGVLLRTCIGYLLWPLAALFLCASVTEVWVAMLAYSIYLLIGPWLVYTPLSGYPPALLFHYGILARLGPEPASEASWRFLGTPDSMFVCLVHALFCLLPTTLWAACVVARRLQLQPYSPAASRSASSDSANSSLGRQRVEASSAQTFVAGIPASGIAAAAGCLRWSFSVPQLWALLFLAAFNCSGLYLRACSLTGGLSLALSPGFAWTLPLALLLVLSWGGGHKHRGLGACKGE